MNEKTQFDLSKLSLFIGVPTNRPIDPRVVMALWDTQSLLMRRGINVTLCLDAGCSRVERARNNVAWAFLASDYNRLLWLDDDQEFAPEQVVRLLCFSTELGIVGTIYPQKRDPIELRFSAKQKKFMPVEKWGLIRVDGMGLGFTMVAREVMQANADIAPLVKFDGIAGRMPMIFRPRLSAEMEDVGEDIGFFADCRELGYDVWVDPAMKIGHIGTKVYEGTIAEVARAKMIERDGAVPGKSPTTTEKINVAARQRVAGGYLE